MTQTSGFSPKVSCQMCDLDVLQELQAIFGGRIYATTKRQPHWKDAWVWGISGENAKECMESVYPYMKSRRQSKIDDAITKWTTYGRPYVYPKENNILAAKAYLAGKGSYRQLSKEFGIGYETIRKTVVKLTA